MVHKRTAVLRRAGSGRCEWDIMTNSRRPPDATRRSGLCRVWCELVDCSERVQTSNTLSETVLSCCGNAVHTAEAAATQTRQFCRVRHDSVLKYTHTHPFNGPFSSTTRASRYQKSKTNLDFTEARDSEWQWHQLDHMQVCTSLQTDNHASTHHSVFYRPDALPAAQPTASKH